MELKDSIQSCKLSTSFRRQTLLVKSSVCCIYAALGRPALEGRALMLRALSTSRKIEHSRAGSLDKELVPDSRISYRFEELDSVLAPFK